MMRIKNIAVLEERGFFPAYGGVLYALVLGQCLWIGAGALSYDPVVTREFASLRPGMYVPLLGALFGGAVLFSMKFQDLISDYLTQFNYSEKFAYMLVHILFFFMPLFILRRPSGTFSLLSLNLFILVTLVQPRCFARLYLSNLFLLCTIIIKTPTVPPLWVATAYLLLALPMCLDYFYFKSRQYDSGRMISFSELLRIVARYILPPILLAAILYATLPPMHRHLMPHGGIPLRGVGERAAPVEPNLSSRLVIYAAIIAVLLMFTLALMNWLQRHLRGKNPPQFIEMKGIIRKVRHFVEDILIRPRRRRPSSPRESIIHDYNRFCEEMGHVGLERAISQTPQEYTRTLQPAVSARWNNLLDMTSAFENVMYGDENVDETYAAWFRGEVDSLLKIFAE
jgi:hypothetical protein